MTDLTANLTAQDRLTAIQSRIAKLAAELEAACYAAAEEVSDIPADETLTFELRLDAHEALMDMGFSVERLIRTL